MIQSRKEHNVVGQAHGMTHEFPEPTPWRISQNPIDPFVEIEEVLALIQFTPPVPMGPTFPPTVPNPIALAGGGPIGGQIGLPSYFMPGDEYNPMWHIGFITWKVRPAEVIKGIPRAEELRAGGRIEITEWPAPPNAGLDNYDFENPNPPHVVNCPVPMTVDIAIHRATR